MIQSGRLLKPLSTLLIANRGEIACRIIRTARRMGIRTVAVYSEADATALHVQMADEAHLIGPAPARESYLDIARIIEAAQKASADAIHPGYGFLSENPLFAEACAEAGITFVGPSPAAMRALGLKSHAKTLAKSAGVPVVPGYHGEDQDPALLRAEAERIGFPLLVKAIAGGGGKGLKRVDSMDEFDAALESAKREAASSFGDDRVLLEKYLLKPRHIEVQIIADGHGNAVHLFERDCSAQRRHQKIIEEAPAPGLSAELRAHLGACAVRLAQSVSYTGAGTVEFIASHEDLSPESCYFMEMNARLQVEHPVTEAITGLDLVEWQLRIAAGEALPFAQESLTAQGHAVEARLYAEDPENEFLPSTGKLYRVAWPEDVRVETGVTEDDTITPFYDPMIAKLIAHAPTREEALARLSHAITATRIIGPRTNLAFLQALIDHPAFAAGGIDTGFIGENLYELGAHTTPPALKALAAGAGAWLAAEQARLQALEAARSDEPASPWALNDAFRLGPPAAQHHAFTANGEPVTLPLSLTPTHDAETAVTPDGVLVLHQGRQTTLTPLDLFATREEAHEGDVTLIAPLNGRMVAVLVEEGQRVERGQKLLVLEAMKMEHASIAPRAGIVSKIYVKAQQQVERGKEMIRISNEQI